MWIMRLATSQWGVPITDQYSVCRNALKFVVFYTVTLVISHNNYRSLPHHLQMSDLRGASVGALAI